MVQTVKFSNGSFQNESGKQDFAGAIQSSVVRTQLEKRQKKGVRLSTDTFLFINMMISQIPWVRQVNYN